MQSVSMFTEIFISTVKKIKERCCSFLVLELALNVLALVAYTITKRTFRPNFFHVV